MYVPSETIFYELITNSPQIEEYSKQKNVVMASPNTLSYFLKIILVAYQQGQLEKHAGEILKALSGIKIEAEKINDDMGVLEKHISNSFNSVGNIRNKYQKFVNNIESLKRLGNTTEQEKLESGLGL
jgi:DNA recombination protein RmuC